MAVRRVTHTRVDLDCCPAEPVFYAELECGHIVPPDHPEGTTVECAACDRQAEAERSACGSTRDGGTCRVFQRPHPCPDHPRP